MTPTTVPYAEMDPATVPLCRLINSKFPGLQTTSSCQGFVDGHRPGEPWGVYFRIDRRVRHIRDAVDSLELLTWMINGDLRRAHRVHVGINSYPPSWNKWPLYFYLKGEAIHPDDVAAAIERYLAIVRKRR